MPIIVIFTIARKGQLNSFLLQFILFYKLTYAKLIESEFLFFIRKRTTKNCRVSNTSLRFTGCLLTALSAVFVRHHKNLALDKEQNRIV